MGLTRPINFNSNFNTNFLDIYIRYMGRLKKYNTLEEKKEANKASYRKYYWKNKEARDQQSRINYKKKNGNREDSGNLQDHQP